MGVCIVHIQQYGIGSEKLPRGRTAPTLRRVHSRTSEMKARLLFCTFCPAWNGIRATKAAEIQQSLAKSGRVKTRGRVLETVSSERRILQVPR